MKATDLPALIGVIISFLLLGPQGSAQPPATLADLLEEETNAVPAGRPPVIEDSPRERPTSPAAPQPRQTASGPKQLAVPSAAEVKSALDKVKDIFATEYLAAKAADEKSKLAKQLASYAKPDQPPASRYALLREAVRLAAQAGDVEVALAAADEMFSTFAADRDAGMLELYQSLLRTASPAAARNLAESVLKFTEEAMRNDRTENLETAVPLLLSVARKARDPLLIKKAGAMKIWLAEKAALAAKLTPLRAKLSESPSDPQANLEFGELLCFVDGKWEQGLPYLAKGADQALAAVAAAELAARGRPDARAALVLADSWYDWLQDQKGAYRSAAEGRAIGHYLAARAGVTGLESVRVGKRITELEKNSGFKGISSPLQDQKVADIKGGSEKFWRFGVVNNQPYKVQGKEWRRSLYLRPQDGGTSVIEFELPGKHRRLQGHVGIFEHPSNSHIKKTVSPIVFSAVGDGKLLWKSRQLTNRDDIERFSFDVSGITTLELHTTATGSANFAFAAWLDPELVE